MSQQSTTANTSPFRHRRTRALLAGGLVLGLGAAGTLAAWSDSEFAFGTFNAGQFNIQGSTDGSSWSDHFTANGAGLTFTTGFSAMQPGTTYYAPFSLRVDPTKNSYDASTVLASSTATGNDVLEQKLSWGARTVSSPQNCTAAGYSAGAALVPEGSAMDRATPSSAFTLPKSSTPVTVCFAVTMAPQADGTNPGAPEWTFGTGSVTAVWRFDATSV